MKICVLVKEVPDAAVEKRIDASTGRLDRSGEKNLNPYDTHAIEAAMQIREGGGLEVEEIVAVTMGPESAVRALHKAVSLGADRSVQLTDDALAGSDVAATGYALAKVVEKEQPDLVLLGQQSDDGADRVALAVIGLLAEQDEVGLLLLQRLRERVAGGGDVGAGERLVAQVHRAVGAERDGLVEGARRALGAHRHRHDLLDRDRSALADLHRSLDHMRVIRVQVLLT